MTWAWVKAASQYLFACDTQRLSDTLEVRQPSTEKKVETKSIPQPGGSVAKGFWFEMFASETL